MINIRHENVCAWTNGFIFVLVDFWREKIGPSHREDGERLNAVCNARWMHAGEFKGGQTPELDLMAMCYVARMDLPNAQSIEIRHGNQAVRISAERT